MEADEKDAATGRHVGGVQGTVRLLADSISVEEAGRASRQVREAIAQQQRQLEELQRFTDENTSLSELVLELPDSVSHRIMVPFGKVAFFPGRLIHTNEFLVLLGESHYAERSAKQTVEILDRRSNFLDQKLAIVKDQIADLEAESSFVINMAEEAKGGLVEIREEYMGSGQPQLNQSPASRITAAASLSQTNPVSEVGRGSRFGASTSSSRNASANEDLEHELLMARFSELELAEAAAGEDNEDSDEEVDEDKRIVESFRSNQHASEVSRSKNDSVEEDYDSEETEEDGSQLSTSDNEDDNVEDAQRSSEDDEDNYQKSVQVPLEGRPLSRFSREVHAKETLHSQQVHQNVTTQQRSPTDKGPKSMVNPETSSRTLENPEAIQGLNDLQKKGIQRGVHLKDRHAEEIKNGVSLFSDHSRVPSLGKPAATQLKAFSGIVTEHGSTELATAIKQQNLRASIRNYFWRVPSLSNITVRDEYNEMKTFK